MCKKIPNSLFEVLQANYNNKLLKLVHEEPKPLKRNVI